MAGEARCGKVQEMRVCSGDFDLERGVQEAGAPVCAREAGRLGTLQAAAARGLEEALILGVVVVQEREALASQHEAALVVEDIMHVVREETVLTQESVEHELEVGHGEIFGVVEDGRPAEQAAGSEEECQAPGLEEKAMQPQLAERRCSRRSFGSPLEALEAFQLQLKAQEARDRWSYCRLRRNMHQRRQLHREPRRNIIQCIPGFWAKAILNHPHISALISDQDKDMLSYMTHLEVQELSHGRYHCQLKVFFRSDPYFLNEVIVKKYQVIFAGHRQCHSTPDWWYWDYERGCSSRRHDSGGLNFFNWLSDHNCPGSSRIAEIINEDLWPDPLQYYPRDADTRHLSPCISGGAS